MTDSLATGFDAPQQVPRPLPLFLAMLRGETAASPTRRARALAGLRAYQHAPRPPKPPQRPAVAQVGRVILRNGGGSGPAVVFVPSLINPPDVLDLPGVSLVAWIAAQGFQPYLVDWGEPTSADHALDIAGHVEQHLLPLIDDLPDPPILVGYCLGGTMAVAAACARDVAGIATIAMPWRFERYPERARADADALWTAAEPTARALGLVPIEVFQSAFWRLDPARTVAKFEGFADLDPRSPAARRFVALEDWANGGAPLTYAAGRDLFEAFGRDDLPGSGRWQVAGVAADPTRLACPAIEFVSTTDRIVPAAAATDVLHRRDIAAGHVGMVIGSRAQPLLWEPLVDWCRSIAMSR